MAAPSLTYTLTNGTPADASQVQQNFNDLLNGITDGTKDLSISALTLAGTLTANGHVNLGNSTSDDVTITGSLASSLIPKTTNAYDLGSTTLGYRAAYYGANSFTTKVQGSSSMAASWAWTWPTSGGVNGKVLRTDGAGVTSWGWPSVNVVTASGNMTITDTDGYDLWLIDTNGADRTITLPTLADNIGRQITIVKTDATATSSVRRLIVDGEGAETISGLANINLALQHDAITLVATSTEWKFVGEFYYSLVDSVTFTMNGTSPGAASTKDAIFIRRGQHVTAHLQNHTSTTSSGGTASDTYSSGAIASVFRPTATVSGLYQARNGSAATNAGLWDVTSAGVIELYRDATGTAWSVSVTGGLLQRLTLNWTIGL